MASRILGGAKLKAELDKIARGLKEGGTLRVGFLSGATYPDGKSVAMIAAIQEFGAPSKGIPSRPFFRNMIATESAGWAPLLARQLKQSYDTKKALGRVGAVIAGELKQSIVDTNEPPLAPATVAKKGFSKPLIDTAVLINSIDFEVNDERYQGPRGYQAPAKRNGKRR
ncbi:MAG: hypothetical protein KGL35_14200 [Bradyrhizobium sp.]|nr:hypothetical protein [Bradyrhizobium sp.]